MAADNIEASDIPDRIDTLEESTGAMVTVAVELWVLMRLELVRDRTGLATKTDEGVTLFWCLCSWLVLFRSPGKSVGEEV